MKPRQSAPITGTCGRCGECCRWLPIVMVRQCTPSQLHYLRERGLKESGGYILADAPCRHLLPLKDGSRQMMCDIYDRRPATCRDFCGKELSGGRRYYVPAGCTLAAGKDGGAGKGPAESSNSLE